MSDMKDSQKDIEFPEDLPQESYMTFKTSTNESDEVSDETSDMSSHWIIHLENKVIDKIQKESSDTSNMTEEYDEKDDRSDSGSVETTQPEGGINFGKEGLNYVFFKRIGLGGNGEIWEALQCSLHRRLVIKRLRSDLLDRYKGSPKLGYLKRVLHQEAITTANLEHPNIIPIHDFGKDSQDAPLIAMKQVKGLPWSELIKQDESLDSNEYYLKHISILLNVCNAINFAHSKGVIHRDLKPSQVMIGEFGEVHVMDWGLAYFYKNPQIMYEDTDEVFKGISNMSSNPAGTPSYMAPEQTERNLSNIGPWTDIFLIGGILYYILTGKSPYEHADPREAFRKAVNCEFKLPDKCAHQHGIPQELLLICEKCMKKNLHERYYSVVDIIADLKDYLYGSDKKRESKSITDHLKSLPKDNYAEYKSIEDALSDLYRAESLWIDNPDIKAIKLTLLSAYASLALQNNDLILARIEACQISEKDTREALLYKIDSASRQIQKREQVRKALIAVICVILAIMILGGIKYTRDQKRAKNEALEAKNEAVKQRNIAVEAQVEAEKEQYFATLAFVDSLLREGRLRTLLDSLVKKTPIWLRNWEWGYLLSRAYLDEMIIQKGSIGNELMTAGFSPDDSKLITGSRNGSIYIFNSGTGKLIKSEKVHDKSVWTAVFSPDGTKILTASFDNTAKIIDAESLKVLHTLSGHKANLRESAFSHDGKKVATSSRDQHLMIWDTETGKLLIDSKMPDLLYDLTFSPDDSIISLAAFNGLSFIVDAKTGKIKREFKYGENNTLTCAFSHDGKKILAGSGDCILRVSDTENGKLLFMCNNEGGAIYHARFSPDDSLILTSDDIGFCKIWDANTGKLIRKFVAMPSVYKAGFSNKGDRFFTASSEEIRIWNWSKINEPSQIIDKSQIPKDYVTEKFFALSLPFDKDSLWNDKDVEWLKNDGRNYVSLKHDFYIVDSYYVKYSPDETLKIWIDPKKYSATLYKTENPEPVKVLRDDKTYNAQFSPSGQYVALSIMDGGYEIWETKTWTKIHASQPNNNTIWSLAFTKDEKGLLCGEIFGEICLLDINTGKEKWRVKEHQKPVVSITLSKDGNRFLTASSDTTAKIFDTNTGKELKVFKGHFSYVFSAVFNNDETRVMTCSYDPSIKIWDVESARELLTIPRETPSYTMMGAFYCKDNTKIIVIRADGKVNTMRAFPWSMEKYPESEDVDFEKRLELYKRRMRLNPDIQLSDICWNNK